MLVHPLGEERKFAYHWLRELAEMLANRGWLVLRLDLIGLGESNGELSQQTWKEWQKDLAETVTFTQSTFSDVPIIIGGLRLGAVACLAQTIQANGFLLLDPFLNGNRYFENILRLVSMKQLLVDGKASVQHHELIDLGGITFSRKMVESIRSLQLHELIASCNQRIGIVVTGSSGQLKDGWLNIRTQFPEIKIEAIRCRPFWGHLVEDIDPLWLEKAKETANALIA